MSDDTLFLELALAAIQPNPAQPRQRFDPVALDELAESLREHGVLQPVLVRPFSEGRYELIAGERRWQAAQRAGLATIPALVLHTSPQRALELALVENVQRADLTALEEADAYRSLMAALGLTQERLAERLGISRVAVTNRLRLLNLTPESRQALLEGRVSEGHARALLALHGVQQDEARRVVEAGRLTVRQTERLVRRLVRTPQRVTGSGLDPAIELLATNLRHALEAQVKVRRRGNGVAVLLHFSSLDHAYRLLEPFASPDDDDL